MWNFSSNHVALFSICGCYAYMAHTEKPLFTSLSRQISSTVTLYQGRILHFLMHISHDCHTSKISFGVGKTVLSQTDKSLSKAIFFRITTRKHIFLPSTFLKLFFKTWQKVSGLYNFFNASIKYKVPGLGLCSISRSL